VFEVFSASWRIVVGDGIVMGTLTAVVLNLVLPTERVRG
jgi:xanthine/uracil permease